jgi:acetyl-CoA/propionyl-CoA carboxylase biotin carboxyl carrier protein
VRLDSGVETGSVIGGAFDSLLAKLIVTGADRQQALERSRRALAEMVVEGMATVLPFDRAVVRDPDFTAEDGRFAVHTRWIETEFVNAIEPFTATADAGQDPLPRQVVVAEVNGRRVQVSLPGDLMLSSSGTSNGAARAGTGRRSRKAAVAAASGDAVTAPMQGTVVKVAVADGDTVTAGDLIAVVEAMKMENPVTAHKDGTVSGLAAEVGAPVTAGAVLAEIR